MYFMVERGRATPIETPETPRSGYTLPNRRLTEKPVAPVVAALRERLRLTDEEVAALISTRETGAGESR